MAIQGLLFDFDDTLGNRMEYIYKAYRALIETFGHVEDAFLFETIVQDCMLWDMRGNYNKEFVKSNLLKKYHIDLHDLDIQDWIARKQTQNATLLDDIVPVLEKLRQSYKMALVTNGSQVLQNEKVDRCGIRQYFDVVVTSQEVGEKKPGGKPFQKALDALGLKAEEVVFIGDTFSTDMYGAYKMGIEPIFVCKESWPCDLNIRRISHIRELL